jgi:hypothetical protein
VQRKNSKEMNLGKAVEKALFNIVIMAEFT